MRVDAGGETIFTPCKKKTLNPEFHQKMAFRNIDMNEEQNRFMEFDVIDDVFMSIHKKKIYIYIFFYF